MERLVYTKIGNDTISIDLHNDYSVIAMKLFDKDTKIYKVTFYIKSNQVNNLDLIEKQEHVEFEVDITTINSAILKHVATLLSEGFYDYYIKRYDYMLKCFDIGNELLNGDIEENNDVR